MDRHPTRAAVTATLLAVAAAAWAPASADDDAALLALGKKLFTQATPACALCHTLQDAGAQGRVGPVLDELRPDAERVGKALREGVGVMPSYEEQLSEEEIRALSLYVAKATGALP